MNMFGFVVLFIVVGFGVVLVFCVGLFNIGVCG